MNPRVAPRTAIQIIFFLCRKSLPYAQSFLMSRPPRVPITAISFGGSYGRRVAASSGDARRAMAVVARRATGPPTGGRGALSARARAARGLRPETKTVDTSTGVLNFDTNSAVANCMKLLNTIPTGTSTVTRIGKRVALKAISIRGQVQAASAGTINKVSLLLIYIRTPNQAATLPAVTEILVTQNSSALTNRDNASKFQILRRWDFIINGNSTTPATGNEMHNLNEFINLGMKPSTWTSASTAGTIAEFEEGALILLSVGDQTNGATTTPVGAYSCRCYYQDA